MLGRSAIGVGAECAVQIIKTASKITVCAAGSSYVLSAIHHESTQVYPTYIIVIEMQHITRCVSMNFFGIKNLSAPFTYNTYLATVLISEKMLMLLQILLFTTCGAQKELPIFSLRESPGASGVCPSSDTLDQLAANATGEVEAILVDLIPALDVREYCPCGGIGNWRRIAHLDMRDPNQECPINWRLITEPNRACG